MLTIRFQGPAETVEKLGRACGKVKPKVLACRTRVILKSLK